MSVELQPIQDDIFRRALNFLGLRGFVESAYSPIVSPVLNIGDLEQPAATQSFASISVGSTIFTCPADQCWKPISFSCVYNQAGGTAAPTRIFLRVSNPNAGGPLFLIPMIVGLTQGPVMEFTPALNATASLTAVFPPGFLIMPGWALSFQNGLAGDGTVTTQSNVLLVRRIFEPGLVQVQ